MAINFDNIVLCWASFEDTWIGFEILGIVQDELKLNQIEKFQNRALGVVSMEANKAQFIGFALFAKI